MVTAANASDQTAAARQPPAGIGRPGRPVGRLQSGWAPPAGGCTGIRASPARRAAPEPGFAPAPATGAVHRPRDQPPLFGPSRARTPGPRPVARRTAPRRHRHPTRASARRGEPEPGFARPRLRLRPRLPAGGLTRRTGDRRHQRPAAPRAFPDPGGSRACLARRPPHRCSCVLPPAGRRGCGGRAVCRSSHRQPAAPDSAAGPRPFGPSDLASPRRPARSATVASVVAAAGPATNPGSRPGAHALSRHSRDFGIRHLPGGSVARPTCIDWAYDAYGVPLAAALGHGRGRRARS